MANFLSKLCKENKPEACQDCKSTTCECFCHARDVSNPNDELLDLEENWVAPYNHNSKRDLKNFLNE